MNIKCPCPTTFGKGHIVILSVHPFFFVRPSILPVSATARSSKINFARWKKTALGPRGKAETCKVWT